MVKRDDRSLHQKQKDEMFICFSENINNIYEESSAKREEIVFMHAQGKHLLVRDFWNYYYQIENTTIDDIIDTVDIKDTFLLVNNNLLVNMCYIDSINAKYIHIGDHVFPVDLRIKQNINNYKELIYSVKEAFDKAKDKEEIVDLGLNDGLDEHYDDFCWHSGHGYQGPFRGG